MVTQPTFSLGDILKFVADKTGCHENEVASQTDITNTLGCSGDDFAELIDEYSKKFNVDMRTYLWYWHTDEEGHSTSIGSIFFKAPYELMPRIPVTPALLLASANAGKWLLEYPVHKLPKRRYDILINQVLVLLLIIFLIYQCMA